MIWILQKNNVINVGMCVLGGRMNQFVVRGVIQDTFTIIMVIVKHVIHQLGQPLPLNVKVICVQIVSLEMITKVMPVIQRKHPKPVLTNVTVVNIMMAEQPKNVVRCLMVSVFMIVAQICFMVTIRHVIPVIVLNVLRQQRNKVIYVVIDSTYMMILITIIVIILHGYVQILISQVKQQKPNVIAVQIV